MLAGSMNDSRVGSRSWWERMKIFEVVIGSNQRFIQPQTVGKKAGAPIICFQPLALDSGALEEWDGTYKDSVQGFRVMSSSKRTSILHMPPQVPKLLQSYSTNIHNIITLRNGRSGVISIHQSCAQRHHESCQVFVEGKEAEKFRRGLAVCSCFRVGFFGGFLVRRHPFAVQMLDFVDIDRNPAAIAAAGPLWVLYNVRREGRRRKTDVPGGVSHRTALYLWSRIVDLIGLPCANPLYP